MRDGKPPVARAPLDRGQTDEMHDAFDAQENQELSPLRLPRPDSPAHVQFSTRAEARCSRRPAMKAAPDIGADRGFGYRQGREHDWIKDGSTRGHWSLFAMHRGRRRKAATDGAHETPTTSSSASTTADTTPTPSIP